MIKLYNLFVLQGIFGFGFVMGIASYQNACIEKIMRLENSRLADQVRARQRYSNVHVEFAIQLKPVM